MERKARRNLFLCVIFIIVSVTAVSIIGINGVVKILSEEKITPQAYQEAMEKGIYEFDNSFEIVGWKKWAHVHFMICEPPKTQEELKAVIEKYVNDNRVVREVRDRIAAEYPGEEDKYVIDLTFYKPSSKFPIGWQARPGYDFIGNEICDNIIFVILIESDQNNQYSYTLEAGEWYDDIQV